MNTSQQEKCPVDFHFLDIMTNIPGAIETIYHHFLIHKNSYPTKSNKNSPHI